jgi:hypothetical protein
VKTCLYRRRLKNESNRMTLTTLARS